MSHRRWLVGFVLPIMAAGLLARADEAVSTNIVSSHANHDMFLLSPFAGFDRNVYSAEDPFTHQTQVHTDIAGDYGVMASYIDPRVTVNNILFYTAPNSSKVWGDIFALTVCGDPQDTVTWALGASYTWHEIEMPGIALRINEPLLRAGPLFRLPSCHLALNPYVGYAHLSVATTYGDDAWDTSVYGIIVRWDWRMLHAFGQYYLQDNPGMNQVYQVARARLTAFVTESWGLMVRGEYMRQYTSKDASLLMGPVYLF